MIIKIVILPQLFQKKPVAPTESKFSPSKTEKKISDSSLEAEIRAPNHDSLTSGQLAPKMFFLDIQVINLGTILRCSEVESLHM